MARGVKHVHCVVCGRHVDVCGPLSARYRCGDCGRTRLVENVTSLHRGEGEPYERWKAGMVRAVQRLQRVG